MAAGPGRSISTSPPEHYFADFENQRNELLNFGRLASKKLVGGGLLEKATIVCDSVLSLAPDDIETHDLKVQVEHLMQHPDNSIDLEPGSIDPGLPPRRFHRSVSERRPRRLAKLWSFDSERSSVSSNGGYETMHTSATNGGDNEVNNEELGNEDDDLSFPSDGTKNKRGSTSLQRSKSDSTHKPISVLQKIARFEQHARNSTSTTDVGQPNSRRPLSMKFELDPDRSCTPIETKPATPEKKFTNKLQFSSETKLLSPLRKSMEVAKENVMGVAEDSPITWSTLGATVDEDLRRELEKEFFESHLLTAGCLATLEGDILGMTRGCKVMKKEIQILINGMTKREFFTSSRVEMGGTIYSCLSATGHVFRARTGILGLNCTTFKKTVLISFYSHPVLPKPVGKLVQHVEKYLADFGF